jgi:sugar phosphate isomerase/epimerase
VRVLVENLASEPTTPERLISILELGHLDNVGICLDLGHAHMSDGIGAAIGTLSKRIASVHMHDNHGLKDEHLWPGDGNIDWKATATALQTLTPQPAVVLEISQTLGNDLTDLPARIGQAFALLG